ncbi:MAG: hypothetical protein M1826_003609 [Phylliscum demangeonii]|nr:MAG: hypothetical protein M1826_003609 [Phylliscum demangeonii]
MRPTRTPDSSPPSSSSPSHRRPGESGSPEPARFGSSPSSQWSFEKPPLKTSKSTVTLQQVTGAFEHRYGAATTLPPGNPPLQSEFSRVDLGIRRPLARKFDPHRQLLKLFLEGFIRWLVTMVIVGATVGTVWGYSRIEVIESEQLGFFNAITTGLLLGLNMNMQSAFKQSAVFVRWKIISNRRQSLQELDLTLGIDSLLRVCKLAWVARAKPIVWLACFVWIVFNYAMFTLIAIVPLTFSAQGSTGSIIVPGTVQVLKLDHFYPKNDSTVVPNMDAEQATAHTYGIVSNTYLAGNATDLATSLIISRVTVGGFLTYNLVDHWVTQFAEKNPGETTSQFYTNRTANATWTCTSYPVVEGVDGDRTEITYLDGDGGNATFNVGETGPTATTYITETEDVCGPRCARVWTFQTRIPDNGTLPMLFDCNITMSEVAHAYLPDHLLPDKQAQIAAGAIGLNGFQHPNTQRQWNRFHAGDNWAGTSSNSANDRGWLIAQFATGVLGYAGQVNPPVLIPGNVAKSGSYISVRWKQFLPLMLGLGLLQLVVTMFSILVANSVIVKDDSRLAIARLLRPLVERLGPSGCLLDGDDISKTLTTEVVYGVRQAGEWHHVDVGHDIQPVRLWDGFPAGWYDGDPDVEVEVEAEGKRVADSPSPSSSSRRRRRRIADEQGARAGDANDGHAPLSARRRRRRRGADGRLKCEQ